MVVISDQANLTATIPPGYALQDYLCSGPLKSNTTVVLDDGEHRISSGPLCNISNEGYIAITGSSNTTVRCEGEGTVFEFISAQKLTMERITFINCGIHLVSIENILIANCTFKDSSNRAIWSQSLVAVSITNCTFINNSATNGDGGGAVWLSLSAGNVSITNCTFHNNSATYGGAVWLSLYTGSVTFTNCTFQNNRALYGTGGGGMILYNSAGYMRIIHCTFHSNSATAESGYVAGGAVRFVTQTGNVSITSCTFQNNSAAATIGLGYVYGGGVIFEPQSTGNVSITNCTFQDNSLTYAGNGHLGGGGVFFGQSTGNVSITSCTFQNNRATYGVGGAVSLSLYTGSVTFTNCTFQNNSASYDGGGMILYNSAGYMRIIHCTFHNNSATTNGGGGAVSLRLYTGSITFTNCTFQNNSASYGGGGVILYNSAGCTRIIHCTFHSNSATAESGYVAGGAVRFVTQTGNVSITSCAFQKNSAATTIGLGYVYGGGVIFDPQSTGNVSITNCTFQDNSVTSAGIGNLGGGGVFFGHSTGDVSITNCTFQNNSLTSAGNGNLVGGGVFIGQSTGNVSITNCTFQNNSLTSAGNGHLVGGGMFFGQSKGDVSITNCAFQNNSATIGLGNVNGGSVCFDQSTGNVSITNCTFQNNSVTSAGIGNLGGGGVFFGQSTGDVSITNCAFQNNSATIGLGNVNGGGVCFDQSTGNVSITNCTFQDNSLTSAGNGSLGGGGVFFGQSTGNVSVTNCAFQNNSATIGLGNVNGGGVCFDQSAGNVSITNCTFQNNSATNGGDGLVGGGGVTFKRPMGDVSITNCTFQNNSVTGSGVGFVGGGSVLLAFGSAGNVSISNCTFQNNSAANGVGGGGGVLLYDLTGDVSITNCTFLNNIVTKVQHVGGGGGVCSFMSTGDVSITNCTFQNNSATYEGVGNSGGGAVLLYGITGSITSSTFEDNSAFYGGAVCWIEVLGDIQSNDINVLLHGSTGNTSIAKCIFKNNTATNGGAVFSWVGVLSNIQNSNTYMELDGSTGYLSITTCTFQNNRATIGGAIFIVSISSILINGSTFTNNTAYAGAAVYVINSYIPMIIFLSSFLTSDTEPLGNLTLQDVIVEGNHCSCNDYNKTMGGAISFTGMKADIFGNTTTGSQFSYNSPLGAIQGTNGFLQLHGSITFTNNTGVNGGAISLSNNVPLYLYERCSVEFSGNVATGFGGAIYNNGDTGELTQPTSNLNKCSIRLIKDCSSSNDCVFNTSMFSITFTDNHAQQGGHAVYATPIYKCTYCVGVLSTGDLSTASSKSDSLTGYFTTTPLPEDANDIQVLSFPAYVHLCGCSDPNLCNITSQYQGKVTTYPGRTVSLYVTSVDDGGGPSPSVVYTLIDTSNITSQNIALGPTQKAQWIGTVCGTIEYQIYGPEMASLKLLLSNYPTNFPTAVEVQLLPCEPGFTLMSSSSTGGMVCGCSLFLISYGVVCDASDGTVTRTKTNWIGVYNNTLPALASTCPLDYCNSTINKLSLARPGDLCNGGRTGIICGHCHGNLSVIFGSSKCQVCTDMWLITLVMFAVLGVLLVAALLFLNLTVTQGTLYGLIYYANIIQVNTSIFFSQSISRPLAVIVSFVNLDLGIPLCFYDGMDDADKAGLQFVFPAYLLIITMTVIVLCHYCLQRSPTTSPRSCCYRLPIIIGERAVGVLSTLIYLSYSKLLRTVIAVFTYSTVYLPSGDMYVWFYDGNVEYLHGKHVVLFVAAMVTCALFLLPYTFALTFIPIIEHYSEHNRLFNYLHRKANQIKPMNDAHYAPYKDEWRWWLGARLWLLVVMYSLNPVFSSDNPALLLSIQATMVILFTVVQAGIKPFGQSLQKTDNNRCTNFCNQLYNCLDLFYLLNYTALALSMSYILDQSSDQAQMTAVSVGVLVGLRGYVVVVMATVLYHLIVVILKACKMYYRAREKINGLFLRKYEAKVPSERKYMSEVKAPIELEELSNSLASTTTVIVNCGLRETLCED